MIDANDPIYAQLSIWQDTNGNGVVDPGELISLAQAGIASINVASTPAPANTTNAGNTITATGTFTFTNGTTSTISDVSFMTDTFHSTYLGNTTVSAAAAAMPNLKGYGTLTDLRVAMTLDPALINSVNVNLSTLNQINMAALRTAAMPILDAWARAVELPDAGGNLHTVDPAAHPDVPILVGTDQDGNPTVNDFAYQATDPSTGVTYWKLASRTAVKDAGGNVIAEPTFAQVMAQDSTGGTTGGTWQAFTGDEIGFIERFMGQPFPIDAPPVDAAGLLPAMTSFITASWNAISLEAVSLAMQGSLASYFQGLSYDAAKNTFEVTTAAQLTPMYQAIFAAAPGDAAGAASFLAQWAPIVQVVLDNLDRGNDLKVTYAYTFASMVPAFEAAHLPLDIASVAGALGVPSDLIVTGGSTVTGPTADSIYYLTGGNQTVVAPGGTDNFVMGGHFGHDVIDATQPNTGQTAVLWFTGVASTGVTASRNGLDLILKVNGTDEQVTIAGEFGGVSPGLFGGGLHPTQGVAQIAFSDGVVWDPVNIAWAVAPNTNGVNGVLSGTPATGRPEA